MSTGKELTTRTVEEKEIELCLMDGDHRSPSNGLRKVVADKEENRKEQSSWGF
jgi:hypothetical protein